jgi:hypothetical protein
MTLDDAIEFIVAKTELLAENAIGPEAREQISKIAKGFDRLWSDPRLSVQQLKSLDAEMLELWMDYSIAPAAEAEIRRKLAARFKTSRLRASEKTVVRRVLKRGSIADLEEYYQVKEFVSCVDNSEVIGEENYGILDSLLDAYDGPGEETPDPEPLPANKPTRRRPPPPFDFILEPDEKLCPPDTPLQIREEFVRAKFARVMEHTSFPEDRETLQYMLKWGMDFAFGPQTPEARRAERFEFCEHEAECFSGYGVSGAQHRAIAAELEKQFGFRRLGPSPQARLARMLASNDTLNQENRLIIERFISSYPHQTLFTRQEVARARVLLKQPSPSNPPTPIKMVPRPKTPPDMSLLCVGAVFEPPRDKRPVRVIAFDAFEVFYEVDYGHDVGWSAGLSRKPIIYYRNITPLFLDGAKRLRVDTPAPRYLALHRPDLPLHFGRSKQVHWSDTPDATREEFVAYLERADPALLGLPPLEIGELVLIPRSRKGALQRAILIKAENGESLTMLELLWQAHQVQRPLESDPTGIGFYRAGLGKRGIPSFLLGGFMSSMALKWDAEAPAAE